MNMRLFILVLASLWALPSHAADFLKLEDACALALKNHPLVRAAQLDTQFAAEGVSIARSGLYPQINGDAARVFADPATRIAASGGLNDPTILDRGSFGLGLSQLITDFGRTSALISASKSDLTAQQEKANLTEASVVLEATRAFYGVLHAQALVQVAETTEAARLTLLDKISSLHDAKLRSDLDLSIARQGVADADLLLLRARTGVDDAYAVLSQALGSPEAERVGQRPTLVSEADLTPPPLDRDSILSQAFRHNPSLRALSAQVEAARRRAEAEKRAQYPTVSALGYAGVSPQRDPAGVLKPGYATGGLVLDVPIFTGGRLSARERQAALHAGSLAEVYADQQNILTRDVEIAFGNAQTAFRNIDVADQLQRNAETTLDLTRNLYEIGKSSIVDLNQAQLAATQAQIVHTDAVFGYRVQRAVLDYLTGDISARS